jgi:Flp pilus assembly protein TadB
MRNGKEGYEAGRDFPHSRVRSERLIRNQVSRFVEAEPKRSTTKKACDVESLGQNGRRDTAYGDKHRNRAPRGTHVAASTGEAQQLLCGEGLDVLETIAIILIVLWLLGMVSGYTLGNFIWVLLVIAVVLFLVRLVSGRRVV